MNSIRSLSTALCLFAFACASAADAIPAIPRVLPPEGLEIPAEVRARLETRLAATKERLDSVRPQQGGLPDVEVFTKAVELALLHGEFYVERDFAKADWALDQANQRLDSLGKGESPWTKTTGLVVAGYRSSIDGSAQPYGLVIPSGHEFGKPCPLYVWLHGRGDKNTDVHFLSERSSRPGQIAPPGAIVVHPFGRHCVGWKHAGEIDVLEVVNAVKQRYKIDSDRVVLIGFSMGGAGAWHIGAHYTERWVAVSPGAGFVDTARYQKITPDRYPEWYVQKLWGLYDVPAYVRNLFNTNVIAYSGELDPQRQAAVFMEEAYQGEGRTLTHLIGPGVEHQYEPKTLTTLLDRVQQIVEAPPAPSDEVHLQTRTLRYPQRQWVAAEGLEEHWKDSRIDGKRTGEALTLTTTNVNRLKLLLRPAWSQLPITLDGQKFAAAPPDAGLQPVFAKEKNRWRLTGSGEQDTDLRKRRGEQGPIDDAFLSSFVVVTPTGKSRNPAFQAWCDAELQHFRDRWRALMRAKLPELRDQDMSPSDWPSRNLVVWGDADSNAVLRGMLNRLPVKFNDGNWTVGQNAYDGNRFVPTLIYPRQSVDSRFSGYLVLNSGLTFREGHDRTNSQQNPKLPDWAIIDITQSPDAFTPGRIHDADFFDESWQLKRQPKAP